MAKIEWNVKNGLNRDLERQHLNKILADIRSSVTSLEAQASAPSANPNNNIKDTVGEMVSDNTERGINVTYNLPKKVLDFAIAAYTLRLTGDVTGSAVVDGTGTVTINTELDSSVVGVEEAPMDNNAYWRRNEEWEPAGESLQTLAELFGVGFAALSTDDFEPTWNLRTFQGPKSIEITNPAGEAGDPSFELDGDVLAPGLGYTYATSLLTGEKGWFRAALFESTGLLSGGALSVLSTTQIRITAALLGYVDYTVNAASPTRTLIQFPQTDVTITNIASQLVTYVGVNSSGTVIQQSTPFTNTQRRTIVPLGVAVHTNLVSLNAVNNLPSVVRGGINQFLDYLIYRGRLHQGIEYTANGANLNLNRSAGTMFAAGGNFQTNPLDPNVVPISAQTALTFRYRTQAGEPAGDITAVNPNLYNSTGSTLVAVPSNDWTVQRIYVFPSGLTRIQYGQATYPNLSAALANWQTEAFVVESNIAENGVPVGLIFVREGATALNNTAQAKFQPLSASGVPAAPSVTLASTDQLTEGTTNLYFTDARARAAVITATITNGDTTHSPSGDAVFDALAGKETAGAAAAALAAANTYTDGEIADLATVYQTIIPTGTTAQFYRGDKVFSDTFTGTFLIVGDGGGQGGLDLTRYSNDTAPASVRSFKARGSLSSPAAVQLNDVLVFHQGRGYFTTGGTPAFSGNVGAVELRALENFTASAQGTVWTFSTVTPTTTTRVDRVSIDNEAIYPPTTNVLSSGKTALRWSTVFTVNINGSGTLVLSSIITPTTLAANTDNYDPTGNATAYELRISASAPVNLTGILAGTSGQEKILSNIGTQTITLVHDATSTAANRFFAANNTNVALRQNGQVRIRYDATSARWRVLGA